MDLVAGRHFTAERRPIRHLDPVLIAVVVGLSAIGPFMIYAATKAQLLAQHTDPGLQAKKQLTFMALGLVVMILAATFDYRFYKVYAGFAFAAVLTLLVLVRTPLGSSSLGAQRWFQIAGFQFTPSEYMKIALIVMLAAFLSELRSQELSLQEVYRATAIALVPMVLVFLQPDIGTTMVLGAVLGGVLVIAGARLRTLGVLGLTGIVLLFGAFQLGAVKDYQIARLTGFLDPTNDPLQAGYNKNQAETAIGSGGTTGVGYLKGAQTNLNFVPEQSTDFIFTVVGEQFGFVGSAIILFLFAIVIWRAFRIALLSKDPFVTYVAAGVASMFAIQMFVNIGMNVGIMPITGIPLPFISYGGSSLLANFAAVGLLLNVHMRRFK